MSTRRPMQTMLRLFPVLAVCTLLAACNVELYSKLDEREANEMIAVLLRNGIDAQRVVSKEGLNSITVDKKRLGEAIDLLRAEGLPKQSFATMGDVFKGSGLVATPTEERARFIYALSEELSRTISSIDGVVSARIHVVLPKNDPLQQGYNPSSASIFIRHDPESSVKTLTGQLKMLVANSIEGLSYEKVSVIFVPVERRSRVEAMAPAQTGSIRRPPALPWLVEGNGWAIAAAALLATLAGGFGVLRFMAGRNLRRGRSQDATFPSDVKA